MSMMAHRTKVLPGLTFRLQLAVVAPYNADFDGDEMNLHLAQSAESMLELEHLCRVSLNIISPENSSPVIGICQDSLVGGYLMTNDGVLLTRKHFMNLMFRNSSYIYEMPAPAGPNGMWTGKQAFSMILPEIDVVYPGDEKVVIKGGQLIEGRVGKAQLGGTKRSLVHILFNDYSPAECLRFLDNEQAITNSWLLNNNAFSVGLSDCILPAEGTQAVQAVIQDKLAQAYQLLHKAHEDDMELMYGKAPVDDFELQMTALLNSVRDATKPQDKIADKNNRFLAMFQSRSKGKKENLAQIMSCLGQQVVSVRQADGTYKQQRIPYNYGKIKGGFEGRTLPHFHKHDDSPSARGFVMHSYLEGLNPFEFFFHNGSGREGLIDTAIKTADTGYLQRQLIKLMEDCKVHYDGTVRNSSRLILQYSYGEDNLDCTKLEYDGMCERIFSSSNISLAEDFKLSVNEDWPKLVEAKIRKEIQKDTGLAALLDAEFKQVYDGRELLRDEIFKMPIGKHSLMAKVSDSIATYLPLNMVRLIGRVKRQFRSRKILSDLNPRYIVESVSSLIEKLAGVFSVKSEYMKQILRRDKMMYDIVFRAHLSARQILVKHRLTKEMFDFLLIAIEASFQKARVSYGEMVGIIAAQSLGQPTTQMTLNSVHFDSQLLLSIDGALVRTSIGAFIESHLEQLELEDSVALEKHPHDTLLGWIRNQNVKILSCDNQGKVDWHLVEAVTRHPVVNEDGSNTLLRVRLHSGREVVATKGKSFLKRLDNRIVQVNGADIVVGDYLPVNNHLPILCEARFLDVSDYLKKSEFIFMTEVKKGLEYKLAAGSKGQYWHRHHGADFQTPFSRSDAFQAAFLGTPTRSATRANKTQEGCVYPRVATLATAHISEQMPLDEMFGWFCGAYAAEGDCTEHAVLISNLDDDFNEKIDAFCRCYSIKYHIQYRKDAKGETKTLRMHCQVLARLMTVLFGRKSIEKAFPAQLLAAPKTFLRGFVDGYFSGDGCLDAHRNYISAYGARLELMSGIQQVLLRFGVRADVRQMTEEAHHKLTTKFNVAVRGYVLTVLSADTTAFKREFKLTIGYKQSRLAAFNSKLQFSKADIIPNVKTEQWGILDIARGDVDQYLETASKADRSVISNILEEEVFYDQVVEITEVANDHPWVYDLTVETTRNFSLFDGLNCADTFHSSGISMEFNVVDGVPRLKELIGASKNPKAPQITIYLKSEYASDEERAGIVRNKLRSTKLRDITQKSEIIYDPSDDETLINTDVEFMQSYYNFMKNAACSFDTSWVLRIELDRSKMLERNLRMWEVQMKLEEKFGDEIHCIFSDDNYKSLVIRIRLGSDRTDMGGSSNREDDDIVQLMKHFERSIMDGLVLRGVPGVNNAFIPTRASRPCTLRIAEDGSVLEDNDTREIVIIAEGTNDSGLMEVMKLPEVDKQRTCSNYIYEVYLLLGVEAARSLLLREIFKVFQSGDAFINHRHIEMLVDTMTCKGDLTPITRNGIQRLNVGPLARSSFEMTEQEFTNAAAFAEVDNFQGVSSNIMCGQRFPGGTGECDIVLDEDRLFQKLKLPPIAEAQKAVVDEPFAAEIQQQARSQLHFDFSLAGTPSSSNAARFELEAVEDISFS